MADTLNKPKLQLRNSFNANANEKTPSPATKLLLNHGKPNFTIQKTPNANGTTTNPLSPLAPNGNSDAKNNTSNGVNNNPNNNYNPYKSASVVVKSTKFNGVFNAASITTTTQKSQSESNEATKVVLRKVAKSNDNDAVDGEDANVPEFIRRQRRIQERLAKENLDFENRRSGYFTHVVITPTSPNRSSFVETMASPAVMPSLEMPVTAAQAPQAQQATVQEESENEVAAEQQQQADAYTNGHSNGHVNTPEEEEEVAKAIEEVNKAVAGEDDTTTSDQHEEEETVEVVSGVGPVEAIEVREQHEAPVAVARSLIQSYTEELHSSVSASEETEEHVTEEAAPAHIEANVEIKAETLVEEVVSTAQSTVEHIQTNGTEHAHENGHATENGDAVTISHTNGVLDGPSIPSPDPSGALGVNYEPKTVVSFSKDLGADENKYPDTVKVIKEGAAAPIDPELQDIAKLKFDITADGADVTPVLRTD